MKASPAQVKEFLAQHPDAVVGSAAPAAGAEPLKGKGRHVRHETDRMNKTEAAYALHLDNAKAAGEIAFYWFESVKFRLADKTWYEPDFFVMRCDGTLEVHEVKGHWEDDARVKWKVAADLYPLFLFVAVTKEGKGWREEVYRGKNEDSW